MYLMSTAIWIMLLTIIDGYFDIHWNNLVGKYTKLNVNIELMLMTKIYTNMNVRPFDWKTELYLFDCNFNTTIRMMSNYKSIHDEESICFGRMIK